MIKAVIFDMDGLMIDSEPLHYEAYAAVFRELGKKYPLEDNNRLYIGLSDKDQATDMVDRYSLSLSQEEIVKRKQQEFKKLIATSLTPQKGLMKLLSYLKKKKYKIAIASSSGNEEIALVIQSLKIKSYIDTYCSADEVRHAKPAPDLFLLAAKKLHVKPDECVVLEDSPRGIEAAVQAGMVSFAIPSEQTKDKDFSKATKKLKSLEEVTKQLKNI